MKALPPAGIVVAVVSWYRPHDPPGKRWIARSVAREWGAQGWRFEQVWLLPEAVRGQLPRLCTKAEGRGRTSAAAACRMGEYLARLGGCRLL
jgi:hypothetical protein